MEAENLQFLKAPKAPQVFPMSSWALEPLFCTIYTSYGQCSCLEKNLKKRCEKFHDRLVMPLVSRHERIAVRMPGSW